MSGKFAAAVCDCFQFGDLLLNALRVALCEALVALDGYICLACDLGDMSVHATTVCSGVVGDGPFFRALALSALRWAWTGLKLRSFAMLKASNKSLSYDMIGESEVFLSRINKQK